MRRVEKKIHEFAVYLDGAWGEEKQGQEVSWGAPHAWFAALGAEVITSWVGELQRHRLRTASIKRNLTTVLSYLDKCLDECNLNNDGGQDKLQAIELITEARGEVALYLNPE